MKKIAVTFPIFNGLAYTKKCIQQIYACKKKSAEVDKTVCVVITDDGSTDGSSEWIKSNFPDVILQYGDGNLWWSGGINKAVDYILSDDEIDYMLLWNSDVKPDDSYFENLIQVAKEIDTNTIVLSKAYFLDRPDTIVSMGGVFNPVNGKYYLRGYGDKDNDTYNTITEADWFGGMGTLIHKDILKKVGHFDEKNFPQYHGDSDFGLRAKKIGIKLLVYPNLKIYNDRSQTGLSNDKSFSTFLKSLYSIKSNHNIGKLLLFYKKHGKSPLVILNICNHYFKHIGGYFKWLFLGLFGMKRKVKN